MVWLIATVCMGLLGAIGYYSGPIRGAFSFLGLFFGLILANPLAPIASHLMPMFGLKHPIWQFFLPQALGFLIVVIVFTVAGEGVHRKLYLHFKYRVDEKKLIRWNRMYARTGLCVGILNGAVYFFMILIPIYIGGYFTAEAATADNNPPAAQFLTKTREQMHALNLDKVVGAYDPTPAQVYQASDILDLVMHNPLLKSRISHYPPFLSIGQRPEIQALANDGTLLEMIDRQASINEILKYPAVENIVTNAQITGMIYTVLDKDLNDLQEYLNTGKSPKFDDEPLIGVWSIDGQASVLEERKRHPGMGLRLFSHVRQEMNPIMRDLTLTLTPDHQAILKKLGAGSSTATPVSVGTWKKDGGYQITLPGSKPDTAEIEIADGDTMLLPKDGYVLVFDKEM